MQCIRVEGCAVQREVCSVSSLAPVKARHWFSSACTFVYYCTLKPNLITVIEFIGHGDTVLLPTKKKRGLSLQDTCDIFLISHIAHPLCFGTTTLRNWAGMDCRLAFLSLAPLHISGRAKLVGPRRLQLHLVLQNEAN